MIERRFRQQRLIPAFMEPRSVVVDPTGRADHGVDVDAGAALRPRASSPWSTGTPERKIRVIAPDVGGGFGGKLQFTPEEVITFLLARQLRQAGEVHRDAQRVDAVRRTTAATRSSS